MKGQRAALAAAVVVILLASAAATGTTYSWWSAENTTSMSIETPDMGISTSVESSPNGMSFSASGNDVSGTLATGSSGELKLKVENTGDVPVLFTGTVSFVSYMAYNSTTERESANYLGELKQISEGWTLAPARTDGTIYRSINLNSISVGNTSTDSAPVYTSSDSSGTVSYSESSTWTSVSSTMDVPSNIMVQVGESSDKAVVADQVKYILVRTFTHATSAEDILLFPGQSSEFSVYLSVGASFDPSKTNSTLTLDIEAVQAPGKTVDSIGSLNWTVDSAYALLNAGGNGSGSTVSLGSDVLSGIQGDSLAFTATDSTGTRTLALALTGSGTLKGEAVFTTVLTGEPAISVTYTEGSTTHYVPFSVSYDPSGNAVVTFDGDFSQSTSYTVSYAGGS